MTPGHGDGRAAGVSTSASAFLADALRRPLDQGDTRVITLPAPVAPPEALLARAADPALFWTTPGRAIHVGLGAAREVRATGPDRFSSVREAGAALFDGVESVPHPDTGGDATSPRLFGGFSFLPGPQGPEWDGFGEARFVLPRLRYTVDGDRATLSVAVTARALEAAGVEGLAREVDALLAVLEEGVESDQGGAPRAGASREAGSSGDAPRPGSGAGQPGPVEPRTAWARALASIQERIEAGRAEKIVAARSRVVVLGAPADVPTLLRRLDRESETAARFAFRFGRAVFVGATPERLVGRSGDTVRTEALAGSVPADRPEEEARLIASVKEEAEHGYVVAAIAEVLEPLCRELRYPAEPRVQRLLHVLHLQTPFEGRLREGVHVLELVERLHPTPAVGGLPTDEALAWIEGEEPGTRGWYAAPVGWFDAAGNGEFGVALRSGLIRGRRAHLYAGAGIVRGSDPEAEFDETEVKLRTMLTALGSA